MEEGVEGAFWLDAADGSIFSASLAPPDPYGQGTPVRGANYTERNLNDLVYDETMDYRGKILGVTVRPDAAEITLEWVSAG